jgi:hypothetical protein
MEAPKGRYSVREQDGRLVVIDNETGAPATAQVPRQRGSPTSTAQPGSLEPGKGPVEWLGNLLVRIVSERIDEEGRAIISWQWTEKGGRVRHWDAALDKGQQRRLGRALLAIASFPLLVLLLIFTDIPVVPALFVVVPLALWGSFSVTRLQRQTSQ